MDIITAIQSMVEELECGVEYMFMSNPEKGGFIVVKEESEEKTRLNHSFKERKFKL